MTGACLARTGLNRKAAYATMTMAIAAEFPDVDTLWSLRGPVEGFTHHRGITHTFLGLPFEAAFVVAGVYGWHRWRTARASRRQAAQPPDTSKVRKPLTAAPVRWGLLYGFALIGLLSHLLLDYTNNYGIRPFFPFNDHWYAASIVFIFDPVLFALLLFALFLPSLFGLIGSEVGARRTAFRGRGLAIAALLGVVGLWSLRAFEHGRAEHLAMAQNIPAPSTPDANTALEATPDTSTPTTTSGIASGAGSDVAPAAPTPVYLEPQRTLLTPDPLSPFKWSAATDFGPVYQLAAIDLRSGSLVPDQRTLFKPDRRRAFLAAEASPLGRAYMDWSPMPVLEAEPGEGATTVVTFSDPRFMGGWIYDAGRTALVGSVEVDAMGRVVQQVLDGRVER
jgi:inner membrane protein